jgi:hypothetical protein
MNPEKKTHPQGLPVYPNPKQKRANPKSAINH